MIKISVGNLYGIFRRFFKKINSPYRLSITNEETMSEVMVLHLTKKSVYIVFSSLVVIIFLLLTALLLFTPLKFYLPSNGNTVSRAKLIQLEKLADSLTKINVVREQYIFNLIQVANGTVSNELDSVALTEKQIEIAKLQNLSKIDHASKYDYLKSIKKDSMESEDAMGKDSLQKNKTFKEKN